jgi:glycosyltransferase involved in cell wall biosynthesis
MKILVATTWLYGNPGGVGTHMQLLVRDLGKDCAGILEFQSICKANERLHWRVLSAARRWWVPNTLRPHAQGLVRLLRDVVCDVVHCHDAMAAWAAATARRKYHKHYRIVATVHGPMSRHMVERGAAPNAPSVQEVERCELAAWRAADALIAVDSTQRDILLEQGASAAKIHVIPNAIDVEEIDNFVRHFGLPKRDDRPLILVPRHLVPKNGVSYAILAAARLNFPFQMFIAGEGVEEQRCRQLITGAKLENKVLLLGTLPRLAVLMLLSMADVCLIPSVPFAGIVEATSIAAIESMAARVPLIASAVGGLREMISHGRTGLLVPPGDPEALAQLISAVVERRIDVTSLVEAARQLVEQRHSLPQWMLAHRRVYESILDTRFAATAV